MPSCPSCGAARIAPSASAPCPQCGAVPPGSPFATASAELELDVPKRGAPRLVRKEVQAEMKIELAVEPRSFQGEANGPGLGTSATIERALAGKQAALDVGDVAFDASLLANYGDPPALWIFWPRYAWRELKRQRELRRALAGRRDEANRARHEL